MKSPCPFMVLLVFVEKPCTFSCCEFMKKKDEKRKMQKKSRILTIYRHSSVNSRLFEVFSCESPTFTGRTFESYEQKKIQCSSVKYTLVHWSTLSVVDKHRHLEHQYILLFRLLCRKDESCAAGVCQLHLYLCALDVVKNLYE